MRKKKFRPVAGNPLIRRDPQNTEMPGLVALEMLGRKDLNEDHVYSMVANADIVQRLDKVPQPVLDAAKAIKEASQRALSRTPIGVSGDDMQALKKNLPITIKFLRTQHPATIWKAAMAAVREFETKGGLRI